MKYGIYKFFLPFTLLLASPRVFSQTAISVDINSVLRTIPQHAVGINMNYLMDGSFLSAGTTAATTQTLKTMGMKMLRYPGGEKSDNYLWSSSPYDRSKPATLLTGDCQFPSGDTRFVENDAKTCKPLVLDFDEFMTVCQQTGAEPFIVCAYDAAYYGSSEAATNACGAKPTKQQLIDNAKEWVRYANKTKNYGIKYWSIGNESWNDCLYNGCVTAVQYALDIIEFSNAMRSVDPTIKIIANGRGTDWWKALLQNSAAATAIDFFSVSCYPVGNYTGGYKFYQQGNPDLKGEVQVAANAIKNFGSSTDNSRIKIITTEFNSIDFTGAWEDKNDVGHAIVAGEILGQCLEVDRVESMLFWNTRWIDNATNPSSVYDALNKQSGMNANGLMLSVWANNLLSQMVNATKSGSVRSYAFYDGVTNKVNILLINKDLTPQSVNLSVLGFGTNASYARWEYRGSDTGDLAPKYLFIDSAKQISYPYNLTLPAASLTVLNLGTINPVTSLNFTAVLAGNGNAQLNWQTGMDDTGYSYSVERSDDGINWSVIATISADNNTNNNYAYEDINPLIVKTKAYYRISSKSATGQVTFSEIRSISKQGELSIKLLGNPVTNTANFSMTGIRYAALNIKLYNDKGSLVRSYPERAADGIFTLDMSGLPAGVYLFQFISPITQKVVKAVKR